MAEVRRNTAMRTAGVAKVAVAGTSRGKFGNDITNTVVAPNGGAGQQQQAKKRKERELEPKVATRATSNATSQNENPNKKARPTATATTTAVTHTTAPQIAAPPPTSRPQDLLPTPQLFDELMADDDVEDIDAEDGNAVHFVPEYVQDIFRYLRKKEVVDQPSSTYMLRHFEITEGNRTVLVNWMVEVHLDIKTLAESLFLSVSILDRYLQKTPNLPRSRMQLAGITSIFIAGKYEETLTPTLDEYVYFTDNVYTAEQILEMENEMLEKLEWNLSVPIPPHFLRRYSKAAKSDSRLHTLSKYLLELTLPEYGMLAFLPSQIAAAAVFIARKMSGHAPYWTPTLAYYTGYTEEDLRPCAKCLIFVLKKEAERYSRNDGEVSPVTKKYSEQRFYSIAPVALARVSRNAARVAGQK